MNLATLDPEYGGDRFGGLVIGPQPPEVLRRLTGVTTMTLPLRGGLRLQERWLAVAVVSGENAHTLVREVYDAHFGRLAGWAATLVGDRDLAHDFATESFVKLIKHWDSVDDPRPWLYTTTANQIRDHWRKRGREAIAYDRFTAGQEVGVDVAAPAPDAATALTVRSAIESLPHRLRMAVLLHYYADLSVVQVAAQLGKSQGAVKRDLFDARKLLAQQLEGVR